MGYSYFYSGIQVLILATCLIIPVAESGVRHYKFDVVTKKADHLCSSKEIVTVNGKFPGPTLYAREDETVVVRVVNRVKYNVSIHWHGVRQLRSCWSDGPAYITQCPIQPGHSFIYNFTITGQTGTLLYHAHISWLRATVHGALVILPKLGVPYPFPKPNHEAVLVLAEWWKSDTETVIANALESGTNPAVSNAHTFNGHPGVDSNCSRGGFHLEVESGNTYMLRVINAALNDELFFKIAEHTMTVVEVDANYVKPFKTNTILVAPGQTTNVIIKADKPPGKYMLTASTYHDSMMKMDVDKITGTAILQYVGTLPSASTTKTCTPSLHATSVAKKFRNSLRSLNSKKFPARVPLTVDHSLLFTVGLGMNPCPDCMSMNMNGSMNMGGSRFVASVNNITFVMPTIAILQAHVFNIKGVFTTDFPGNPPTTFDYTGPSPSNMQTNSGTKVYRLPYNSTVQLVLQDTGVMASESHPIHLHGFNFFAVGWGLGNYNPKVDPNNFNLVDPVERNTIEVPSNGWVAIRFRADNPGVWFMHCHLEVHTSWGLQMAFLVENGIGPNESIPPPPSDLPKC